MDGSVEKPLKIIRTAEAKRRNELAAHANVWRVLNGPGDGAPPGLYLDRYGDWLVLGARAAVEDELVQRWAQAAIDALQPAGLVVKRIMKGDHRSTVYYGSLPDEPVAVFEKDAVFLCDLDDGLQTGLFLDHRETRWLIRRFARDEEVLNLFAYTCTFSVHAALGGARRVTSIDISKKALRRGRANMTASGLEPDQHRWFSEDVLAYLGRSPKVRYRLIIADPPVMGRAKGKLFSVVKELDWMAERLLEHSEEGGTLVFSTHALELNQKRLVQAFQRAADARGRAISLIQQSGLPTLDHPVVEGSIGDRGNYLKTLVLSVS